MRGCKPSSRARVRSRRTSAVRCGLARGRRSQSWRSTTRTRRFPLFPGLPNTAGVTLGVPAIREWSDTLGDWQAVTVTRRPAGMVRLPRSGEFEIAVSVEAAATIPPEAIEAVARLWAYRDVLKPGDLTEVTGEQQVLAGGMMKSGAAEVLRPLRHTVI